MATAQRVLETILERVADIKGDLTDPVMERFYYDHPGARAHFERLGLGKRQALEREMVDLALYCLMTWFERPEEIRMVFDTSVGHHRDTLLVGVDLYRGLIDSVITVIEDTMPAGAEADRAVIADLRAGLISAINRAHTLA